MKKLIFTLTILAFTASISFAQTDVNVGVNAEILAQIDATFTPGQENVEFGQVQDNANAVLNPSGGSLTDANLGASAEEAEFTMSGGGTATVTFGTATLADAAGDVTLTFTPQITVDGASVLTSGDTSDLTANPVYTVGGTLDILNPASGADPAGVFNTTNGGGSDLVLTFIFN